MLGVLPCKWPVVAEATCRAFASQKFAPWRKATPLKKLISITILPITGVSLVALGQYSNSYQ
jgi:hypothetical protein